MVHFNWAIYMVLYGIASFVIDFNLFQGLLLEVPIWATLQCGTTKETSIIERKISQPKMHYGNYLLLVKLEHLLSI